MKIKLSTLLFIMLASSSQSYGGSESTLPLSIIAPIENLSHQSKYYLGVGGGKENYSILDTKNSFSAFTVLGGVYLGEYISLEARHSRAGNSNERSIASYSVFLKPVYAYEKTALYGLIGYGSVRADSPLTIEALGNMETYSDIQWGIDASYMFLDGFSIFADYTKLFDESDFSSKTQYDVEGVDITTFGFMYRF